MPAPAHADPGRSWPEDRGGRTRAAGRDRSATFASQDKIAGAIYSPIDQTGNSCLFARNLTAWCEQRAGVKFLYGVTIRDLAAEGSRVVSVTTDQGPVAADAFVLAMGAETALLGRKIGLNCRSIP